MRSTAATRQGFNKRLMQRACAASVAGLFVAASVGWCQLERIPPSAKQLWPSLPSAATPPATAVPPGNVPPGNVPPGNVPPGNVLPGDVLPHEPMQPGPGWVWQSLPEGLLYRSYLAGPKEPRLGSALVHDDQLGWVWDHTLGARIGALRYGTLDPLRGEGWQLDFEGAAELRQDPEEELDVVATDFRAGFPLTYARGPLHTKLAYYHISGHLGDEFQLKNPAFTRINYVRDSVVLGIGYWLTDSVRLYGEAAWAFNTDGGAEPWEFQFGAELSPRECTEFYGSPFLAVNGHLREELDFGGSLNVHAGWQWRSPATGRLLRIGFQYYNGASPLYEFFNRHEELIGAGVWYDF